MATRESGNDHIKKFFPYHFPALLYAVLIIVVSSIPDLKPPRLIDFQFDKVAHFMEYAIFAFLTYRSFTHISLRISHKKAFYLSALFLAGFAFLDEIYQYFVPGRKTDILDLITDFLGSAMVLFLLWFRDKDKKTLTGMS